MTENYDYLIMKEVCRWSTSHHNPTTPASNYANRILYRSPKALVSAEVCLDAVNASQKAVATFYYLPLCCYDLVTILLAPFLDNIKIDQ